MKAIVLIIHLAGPNTNLCHKTNSRTCYLLDNILCYFPQRSWRVRSTRRYSAGTGTGTAGAGIRDYSDLVLYSEVRYSSSRITNGQ